VVILVKFGVKDSIRNTPEGPHWISAGLENVTLDIIIKVEDHS
jgi:hypothetical protein